MKYLRKMNIELVRGEYANLVKGQVREPKQLYEVFKAIKDKAQELLIGVYLSDTMEVKSYDILSVGGRSAALVLPPEIFARAFVMASDRFILLHNHPKGDPSPSPNDQEVIQALREQSKVMNLVFLDFIIVGDQGYWSMFEEEDGGEYELGGTSG